MPDLLICVDGSASEDDARACREQFDILADRMWSFQLAFVDQLDELPATTPGGLPVLRTIGVAMELPDPGDDTDETAIRDDVAALIEAFSGLARNAAIEFVVEYREEAVGSLDGGAGDVRFVADFFGDN
ncbi:hypothetical protein DVA67_034705 [Solirubrobacter sp. CPCC 204708]|uniref:Universal stress protein n=1 Tax=Solirubrobacter deserti TaxID=2282478 RepID=A0ABT4RVI5_9ACTN|nr:hypothetical protein [Solirubrobacter deserti]MDA0142597.1 hypothetical protein [Solirubrobacter deserti]